LLKTEKVKGSESNAQASPQTDPKLAKSQRTVPLLTKVGSEKRFIPANLRRTIWKRDLGKCKNCKSTYALQIDHIKPFALGGMTEESNLRLLCRSCNLHFAVQEFGTRATQRT
jgi:5-methylcytosine-specific restriction endonuclease McrA